MQCGIYATWLIGLPRHKIVGHGTGGGVGTAGGVGGAAGTMSSAALSSGTTSAAATVSRTHWEHRRGMCTTGGGGTRHFKCAKK